MKRLITVLAVLAALLVVALPAQGTTQTEACAASLRQQAWATKHIHEGSLRVVVMGDSYSMGGGVQQARFAYPVWLAKTMHADVRVLGLSSTGYAAGGPCGYFDYMSRVSSIPLDTQLLVIEGGLNDGTMQSVSAPLGVIEAAKARVPNAKIVVLTTPTTRLVPAETRDRVNSFIRHAGTDAGVDVVCIASWPIRISADDMHPSYLGHRYLGQHLGQVLLHRI